MTIEDDNILAAKAKQAAALHIMGQNQTQIASALGMNNYQLKKLQKNPEYTRHVREIGEQAMEMALNTCRADMEALMKKALSVFHQHLDKGNLQAAIKVMEMAGVTQKDDKKPETGTIKIVLPGQPASEPKDVDVEIE